LSDLVRLAADNFHAHLDVCEQCREHPFDLCRTGADLLMAFGRVHQEEMLGKCRKTEESHK
jgi:hypothetical protein